MLLSLIVVVVAVSGASAIARVTPNDQLYALYSRQKVFESCMGIEYVRAYNDRLQAARDTCASLPSRAQLDEPNSEAIFSASISEGTGVQSYFTEDTVRYLSERMLAKVSNMTCVIKQMGYMDKFDNIDYDALVAEANSIPTAEAQLKTDIAKGINDCKAMAICLPLNDIAYPLTPTLLRWSNFSKCKVSQDYQACLKKDLRERSDEFQLEGLGNFLSDFSDSDKMFAVIWGQSVLNEGGDFLW